MRELQDSTEPDSDGYFSGEDSSFQPNIGWEAEVEYAKYRENKNVDGKIIRLANNKTSLLDIFAQYNIKFIETYSPSGWTHKSRCPFRDHRDSTPSFGFNSAENRFNCLGCQRSGGPVQFIAFLEDKPQVEVAKSLIEKYGSLQDVIIELDDQEDKIDEILFEFAEKIRLFLEDHQNAEALNFAEAITWALDVYLAKHVRFGSVNEENLAVRISKLYEHLDSFGEPNE